MTQSLMQAQATLNDIGNAADLLSNYLTIERHALTENGDQDLSRGKRFRFHHKECGSLTIDRMPMVDNRKIPFKLTLGTSTATAALYMTEQDPNFGNEKTLGYLDINFPQAMQRKGIGYVYHYLAAKTAETMHAKLAVESVVSPALETLLLNIGMDYGDVFGYFWGDPTLISEKARQKSNEKGWKIMDFA